MPTPVSISDSLGEAPSIAQSAGGVKSQIHSPWLSRPGLRPPGKITTTNHQWGGGVAYFFRSTAARRFSSTMYLRGLTGVSLTRTS